MNYETVLKLATEETYTCISLNKCVNRVIADLGPDKFVNDVYPALFVSTEKEVLSEALTLLLEAIVLCNPDTTINISAKLVGNITLLSIKSSKAKENAELTRRLHAVEALAARLGGCVSMNGSKIYGLSLVFTFVNH